MSWIIAASTDEDWVYIKSWLKAEEDQHGSGNGSRGFWCNQKTIGEQHREGLMIVLREDGLAVAFLTGRPAHKDIMEVRPDKRWLGYGRRLAEHWLAAARQSDRAVLQIECSPNTSVPFWSRMGFTLFPRYERFEPWDTPTAYLVLAKTFVLPAGRTEKFKFSLYPEKINWDATTKPLSERVMKGVELPDGTIQLAERFACFHPTQFEGDLVIEVCRGAERLYRNKVKYDEAEELGICRDDVGTYYIDQLFIDNQ